MTRNTSPARPPLGPIWILVLMAALLQPATPARAAIPAPVSKDGPSQEQLDEAKSKLVDWLGGARGETAVGKIMRAADPDRSGAVDSDELYDFLKEIGLGSWLTRGLWRDGILDYIDGDLGNSDERIQRGELRAFLEVLDLA